MFISILLKILLMIDSEKVNVSYYEKYAVIINYHGIFKSAKEDGQNTVWILFHVIT